VALLSPDQRLARRGKPRSPDSELRAFAGSLRETFEFILFVACLLVCTGKMAKAQTQALSESQIKAGFVFNFTKFVEWPTDAFADPESPIVLGVLGDSPITDLLIETAAGKTVNGRAVTIRRFREGQDPRTCHILFVSSSEQKRALQTLERVKGSPVLTVSEASGFTQAGGMINFFVEGNKVRLEINLDAAARARLKISAKVIAVARLVTAELPGGKS
jgi:YfiR/HmsC-like